MAIKCYHCKGNHTTVADVKACSTKPVSITVATGPAKGPQAVAAFLATPDNSWADKVSKVAAAQKTATAVPAHRTSAKYLSLKAQVAPAADLVLPVLTDGHTNPAPIAVVDSISAIQAAAKPVVKTGQDLELGMYQTVDANGVITVYKVTTGKHSSYKQAQKLWISQKDFYNQDTQQWDTKPVGKFYFAKGMMNVLTSANKMSEADAKAFHDATKKKYGVDYGFCCVCGKLLTVKKSIDAGIGPVCAGKL